MKKLIDEYCDFLQSSHYIKLVNIYSVFTTLQNIMRHVHFDWTWKYFHLGSVDILNYFRCRWIHIILYLNLCPKHLSFRSVVLIDFSVPLWGVSRQLSQRAAREPQIVLFLTHVYDTKKYLKKLFDKRFRRIFSSAFQWRR